MGMDEHAPEGLPGRRRRRRGADGVDRPVARAIRVDLASTRTARTTTGSAPPSPATASGVTALIERIRARHPTHLFVGEYEGLYCVGCEEFKPESQIVDGRCIEHPSRELVPTRERNTFFRLSAWRDQVLDAITRRPTSGSNRRSAATRSLRVLRRRTAGHLDLAIAPAVGHSLPRHRRRDGLRLVRCADQLPQRHRLSRRRLGHALAGRPACDRQGDHPLPLHHLAGDADGRRSRRCLAWSGPTAMCSGAAPR